MLTNLLRTARAPRLFSACVLVILTIMLVGCERDPKEAEIPLGNLESVAPGATITGTVSIAGWAVADKGIKEVCLYVDRRLNSCTTSVNFPRPDVAQVWPRIAGSGSSGWQLQFDTSTLPPGPHELVAQAKSNSGATRDLATVPVTISR
jgi:hypothetical protein